MKIARLLAPAALIFSLAACGGEAPLPAEPQLSVDREALQFGGEFGEAVYVGTQPQETLLLRNLGQGTLELEGVDFTGDDEFRVSAATKTSLKSREHAFIQVIFAPQAAGEYSGTITLRSNAANASVQLIQLSGTAVPQP